MGVKPNGWQQKRLLEVAPLQRGFDLPTNKIVNGSYPVVCSNGIIGYHKAYMINGDGVVTGRSGTIGKVQYIRGKFWAHNTTLWVTNFNNNDKKFIYFLMCNVDYSQYSTGSGVPTLNRNDVHLHEVLLPPLQEQKAIATALSDIDGLINSLTKLIEKKKNIKQGAMQELLTGKKRLDRFSGEWAEKQLGEIGEINMCKRIFAQQTTAVRGDIPFYKIGTFGKLPDAYISSALYDEFVKLYSFPIKGDILLSAAGTIGRTVVFDGTPSYFQDSNIVWLEIDKGLICNEYLYHYYQVIEWAASEGSTISRLYNGIIKATTIKVPPTLEEQTAIATILSDMDTEIEKLQAKLNKYKSIKQGMMQELLTGRIRLLEGA